MMYRIPAVSMATTTQPIGYQPMYSGTQVCIIEFIV